MAAITGTRYWMNEWWARRIPIRRKTSELTAKATYSQNAPNASRPFSESVPRGPTLPMIQDRGRAVVQKALGFEEQPQPPVNAHFFEGGDHRHRVGGGDQDAEEHRGSPLPADEIVHSGCREACGNNHAHGGKDQDQRQIFAKLPPGDVEGGFKNQRREEGVEDQLSSQPQIGGKRRKRQPDPGRDQAHGIRQPDPPGQHGDHGGDEQQDFDPFNAQTHCDCYGAHV
jgi:hypothetical protein